MSGPVTRPLKAKESDNSVSVYPCTTLNFDSSDFNITATAQEATITTSGSAGTIGGSITDTQVAYGSSTPNSIEGSADFTFTADAGSGPVLLLTGETPKIDIQDDTGATDYKTRLVQSGLSLYMFSQDSAGTDVELVRMQPGVSFLMTTGKTWISKSRDKMTMICSICLRHKITSGSARFLIVASRGFMSREPGLGHWFV